MMQCIGTRKEGGSSTVVNHNARLTIPISGDIDSRLRREARRRGVGVATLVRPWIAAGLEQAEQEEKPGE